VTAERRWARCVDHRGEQIDAFLADYCKAKGLRCLLIGGAGFDVRSTISARALTARLDDRLNALFVREERGAVGSRLTAAAEQNVQALQKIIPAATFERVQILDTDNAVIGGRNAVELMRAQNLKDFTDVFVDISALSIGTSFPIVRYVLEAAERGTGPRNVHALVVSMPIEDERRRRVSNDAVSLVHSFHGKLRLHSETSSARLWIPQLSVPKLAALEKIYGSNQFDDVCPILPFPSKNPRAADNIIEAFIEQLDRAWEVDGRNIVYAAEDDPLDVYRTILDIEEQRCAVFENRSVVVLSPIGSKAVALGSLMAAIEKDLPVVYVEALKYTSPSKEETMERDSELLHVWLRGDAYPS
jgi:hypothetical protein